MWVGIQRSEERREYDRRHDVERLNKMLGQNMRAIQAKNECLQNTEIIWNLLSHMFSCQRSQMCMNTQQREQLMKEAKNERDRNVRHHRKHLCVDGITITMDLMTQVLWHTLSRQHNRIWLVNERAVWVREIPPTSLFRYFQFILYNEFKWLCHSKTILPNTSDNPTANKTKTLHSDVGSVSPLFYFRPV